MRSNIWRVDDVQKTLRYICRTGECQYDDRAVIVAANVSRDVVRASKEMRAVAGLRQSSKRRFVHFVLSLKSDELTRLQWESAVKTAHERLGLHPRLHLFLAAVHVGGMHQHCHVLASRVGLDGTLWAGEQDMRLLTEATRQIVRDLGLNIGHLDNKSGDHRSLININRALKKRGLPPLSGDEIATNLLECLSASTTVDSFIARSGELGYRLETTVDAHGAAQGLVLLVEGTKYRLGLGKLSRGRITLGSVQELFNDRRQSYTASDSGEGLPTSEFDSAWDAYEDYEEQAAASEKGPVGYSYQSESTLHDSSECDTEPDRSDTTPPSS